MEKIGIFYGTDTAKTAAIALEIIREFGSENIETVSVEKAWKEDFDKYKYLVIGASTWFDGELPTYWDEILPELSELSLKSKKIAIFGLGDQVRYPENFADSVGILAEIFTACGGKLVGFTSPEDYLFEKSRALKDGSFQGLVIDVENQNDKNEKRIKDWVTQLKKEFQK